MRWQSQTLPVSNRIKRNLLWFPSLVKGGEEAMAVYNELFYQEDKNKIQQKLQELKTYCQTDTLVLYHIFEKLKEIIK